MVEDVFLRETFDVLNSNLPFRTKEVGRWGGQTPGFSHPRLQILQ